MEGYGEQNWIQLQCLYVTHAFQRWGTCVKARTFVFAIHAYFTERFLDADVLTSGTPKTIQEFRRVQALANEKVGDLKAMEYISIVNLRPILESFDDDQSG
jgi:hypothetical protein